MKRLFLFGEHYIFRVVKTIAVAMANSQRRPMSQLACLHTVGVNNS
jgi:hypothetical protein